MFFSDSVARDVDIVLRCITQCISFAGVQYKWVLSQKGKYLISVEGYTFKRSSVNAWSCSSGNSRCKAKLRLSPNGVIVAINNDHCHLPREHNN